MSSEINGKVHPWRVCPIGKHLVKEHQLHIPPSKEHPNGVMTTRHRHCADNPSHKDMLSFDEIQEITETYFEGLVGLPTSNTKLQKKYSDADRYDVLIRGWVRYWNDIFQPKEPLDPNLIKALMATESSFQEKPEDDNGAHGLMQIIDPTLQALGDHNGELKNHLIHLSHSELMNPSANICASVRWLFRKKEIATSKLHREVTWEEAIVYYKSYVDQVNAGKTPEPMKRLREYYELLQEQ